MPEYSPPADSGSSGSTGAVTVSTGATLIVAANNGRYDVIIVNNSSNTVYIGTANTVTTSNGIPILSNESIHFPEYLGPVYGVASADSDVRYLEISE